MQNKTLLLTLVAIAAMMLIAVPAFSQTAEPVPKEIELGNITGAVVTLYYYDPVAEKKGAMVDLPENPQYVQWDEQAAAPGTYTFYHVPEGTYYIEAVHNNNSWFAIATVYRGTTTANVAIPPVWNRTPTDVPNIVPTSTPVATPTPVAGTPTPVPTPSSTPAPGMGLLTALAGIGIVSCLAILAGSRR